MSKIQLVVILLSILNVFGNTLVNKESCNSGDKISLSSECIYYRFCENHNYVTKKCPRKAINNIGNWSQQMFDPIKKECVDKRKVIVPGKCNSYNECLINESVSHIERWVESYCPSSLHFDELTQKCIVSNLTNCTVCLSNICKNDGICKEDNKKGGYKCFCKPGFKGKNCEIDSHKKECSTDETYFTDGKGEHICALSNKNETAICDPINSGNNSITLTGHGNWVRSVAFSPNGEFLASGSLDKTIKLWNPENGQLLRTLTGHNNYVYSVAFSPNGEFLASGSSDRTIKLWNPKNGQLLRTLTGHDDYVYSVAFSPNGEFLASSSYKAIKLWNPKNGQLLRTLTGHDDYVYSVAFSPNGEFLASGSADNTIKLWNPKNGQLLRTLTGHDSYVRSVAFSPNGEFLASGSYDKTIKLWNPKNGQLLRTLTGHDDWVRSVSFSPNGEFLASGSLDKTIKLWNPKNGQLLRTLTGHDHYVNSVAFSPNGEFLASGSGDNTIKIWNFCAGI